MDPIITLKQLNNWLQEASVTVIDVRSQLNDPDVGEAAYKQAHIPGAYYLHLEKDLSGKKERHGGNHPLPDVEEFSAKLRDMGVNNDTPVVIYDQANDMFAARAWWLVEYMGHPQVYLLDGGFTAWQQSGHEVSSELPKKKTGSFIPNVRAEMIKSMEEVKKRKNKSILLDSRGPKRYTGETEPMYHKAGHIPGAKNYFWKDVLNDQGAWQSREVLQAQFKALEKTDEVIVSCGSGISACPNIAALRRAGFENVKLYPGSFSDWISYDDNPVATGEE